MRTITEPAEGDRYNSKMADWKAAPPSVLEDVDRQLADHGLEIVMIETGGDCYEWMIAKRVINLMDALRASLANADK